ncbi:MAG: hypothetical protein ACRD44_02350 [Bryobacteraceae bacterium]
MTLGLLAALVAAVPLVQAQSVISAKAGMIHYVEGKVYLNDELTNPKFGQFPDMKNGSVLRTERGRAEVLLGPGIFLRLAEDSSFRMVSNALTESRVELLTGSMLVECAELTPDATTQILYRNAVAKLKKNGLYRMNADPAEILVHDGRAEVTRAGETLELTRGRFVELDEQTLTARRFDAKLTDSLYRWSARRSGYAATANISAAKMVRDNYYSMSRSSWFWNPFLGMMTFIPYHGSIFSPFGYGFYSPQTVYIVYAPRPVYTPSTGGGGPVFDRSLGYNVSSGRSYGNSPVVSSPGPSAAPAPAASPRSSEAASPRGGEGGGRRN